jgi:hypothetical protein
MIIEAYLLWNPRHYLRRFITSGSRHGHALMRARKAYDPTRAGLFSHPTKAAPRGAGARIPKGGARSWIF